jgi:hypothetical protein
MDEAGGKRKARLLYESASPSIRPLLREARSMDFNELDSGLSCYLAPGLEVLDGEAIIATACMAGVQAHRGAFHDPTDFEAFANKFHLEDWCSQDLWLLPLPLRLGQLLHLSARVADAAAALNCRICVYISQADDGDFVFRFHRDREHSPPWTTDPATSTERILLQRWG